MTSDRNDILQKLLATLPAWFGDDAPNINTVLTGMAATGSFNYSEYEYAGLQTRVLSATGVFLDLISLDYLGGNLPRLANESDKSFRTRILVNLVRERGTRKSIIRV